MYSDTLSFLHSLTRQGAGVQIKAAMSKLCQEVGRQATTVVEAFGIPDHLVAAPIAGDWVKYNLVDNQGELTGSQW